MGYTDKWLILNANTFNIRPKHYYSSTNKKKKWKREPSKAAIYEVFAVDAYQMENKMKFLETAKKYNIDIKHAIDKSNANTPHLPQLIIVNIVLPINKKKDEGEITSKATQWTLYSKLSKESQEILENYTNGFIDKLSESISLLSKFIRSCSNNDDGEKQHKDDIKDFFKVTMRVNNLADTSLLFVIKKLVKKSMGQSVAIKDKASY